MVLDFTQTDQHINEAVQYHARQANYTLWQTAQHVGIESQDIYNDILMKAYQYPGPLEGNVLNRLTRNSAIDAIRKYCGRSNHKLNNKIYNHARTMYSLDCVKPGKTTTYLNDLRDKRLNPYDYRLINEQNALLNQAIKSLDEIDRYCLTLQLAGWSLKAIGIHLNLTEGRICQLFKGIRKDGKYRPGIYDKLRTWFEARNITCEDIL